MLNPPKKLTTCPNCQTSLEKLEPFCPNCGQKNQDILLPLKAHLIDIFESIFNWDSRLLRSVKTLFFSPGKMTVEFNEGKRQRYVPPLRLYLIASLLFFLLLSLSSKREIEKVDHSIETMVRNNTDTMSINMGTFSMDLTGNEILALSEFNDAQLDSFLVTRGQKSGLFNRLSLKQSIKAMKGNLSGYIQQLTEAGSISMFILMPVFAGLLMIFFRKPKRFYVEHLILSVHLHTLFFLVAALNILMQFTPLDEIFSFLLIFLSVYYPLAYFKKVYGNPWMRTIGMTILLMLCNLIVLLIMIGIVGMVSLLIF